MLPRKLCKLSNCSNYILQRLLYRQSTRYISVINNNFVLPYSKNLILYRKANNVFLPKLNYTSEVDTSTIKVEFHNSLVHDNSGNLRCAHNIFENHEKYSKLIVKPLQPKEDITVEEIGPLLEKSWTNMPNEEILENFKQLSYYVFRNQSVSIVTYKGILEVLSNRCEQFSDEELQDLLLHLQLWECYFKDTEYECLFRVLDQECLKRMKNWTHNKKLLMNDLFYHLKASRRAEFTWHSLKTMSKLKSFNPAELMLYLYFLRISRSVYIERYNVEYYVEKYLDKYSIDELTIFATLFFYKKQTIRSLDFSIKLMKKILDNIDEVNEFHLIKILSILRLNNDLKSQVNEEHFKAIKDFLEEFETRISHYSLKVSVLFMFLQLYFSCYNEKLISNIFNKFQNEIKLSKLLYLEELMYTSCISNYNNVHPLWSIAIDEILNCRTEEIERHPKKFLQFVRYMLQANNYSEEAVRCVMEPKFVKSIEKGNPYAMNQDYVIIENCLKIEHPEYDGPKLDSEISRILHKRFGSLRTKSPLGRPDFLDKIIEDILKLYKEILGEELAGAEYLLSYYPRPFVILRYDQESNKFLPPGEILSEMPLGTLKYAPNDGMVWYALFPYRQSDCSPLNNKIKGLMSMNLRHLEKMGYRPVSVFVDVLNNFTNEDEKKNYAMINFRQ